MIVGTLLSAPLLVAAADYVADARLGGHGHAAAGHLPTAAVPQLALPYVYGPLFAFSDPKLVVFGIWGSVGGFLSVSLILFAIVGLASGRYRGLRCALLAWIVLALGRMFAEPPGLGALLGVLPGMSRVAFYRYGSHRSSSRSSSSRRSVSTALRCVSRAAASPGRQASLGWSRSHRRSASLRPTAAAARDRSVTSRRRPSGASPWWSPPRHDADAPSRRANETRFGDRRRGGNAPVPRAGGIGASERHRRHRAGRLLAAPSRHGRFFTLGPLQPNYGSYFGIASLNVNDVPVRALRRLRHVPTRPAVDPDVFVGNLGAAARVRARTRTELLRNLDAYRAVSVASSSPGRPPAPAGFTLVFRSPTTWIYRLAGADPLMTAPGCTVTATDDTAQLVCSRRTRLVARVTPLPGWHATLDGRPVHVEAVDGDFQAISVGPGSHHVTFSYSPPFLDWALAAFAVGCVALFLDPFARGRGHRTRI